MEWAVLGRIEKKSKDDYQNMCDTNHILYKKQNQFQIVFKHLVKGNDIVHENLHTFKDVESSDDESY